MSSPTSAILRLIIAGACLSFALSAAERAAAPASARPASAELTDADAAFAKAGTTDKSALPAKLRPSPEATAREKQLRAVLEARFAAAASAWAAGDLAAARAEFRHVLVTPDAPPHFRSYAQLRLAQSFVAGGNPVAAAEEYARLAADPVYPEIHRAEARECRAEIERTSRGLPARDPAATRTKLAPLTALAAEFFIAPNGRDANPGTRAQPFATLERARDVIRARRTAGNPFAGAVAVRLLPGEYTRTATFELTAADSGTPEAPVVYRADSPGTAILYGGTRLGGFVPVTDPAILARLPAEAHGRVFQTDLRAQGITAIPSLQERGYGRPPPKATLELFFNGAPLTIARWPNDGFVNGGKVLDPGSAKSSTTSTPSVFTYLDDRHARWTAAKDAWLYGYFAHGWADRALKIVRIDAEKREVACGPYQLLGRSMEPVKWFNQGRIRYFAFNLLEELDQPGEWYLDRDTGVLYLYPPSNPASAVIEIGRLAVPMVGMKGAAHVRFEGLVFDLSQANGFDWRDCESCVVAGCTVRRFAAEGIGIRGGRDCGIFGCDLYSLGRNATTVIGGDRQTLTPARHYVENCRMYEFGRLDHTYVPAVQLEGVGNRVVHNLFYDCPASVVRIEGNDHVLEFNRVHRALLETEDQGAMELFGNATYRGVVFRYNHFSDIGGGFAGGPAGRAAIRLDDAISGMLIHGNLFHRAAQSFGAINLNGGRDNLIDNNLFLECEKAITGGYNPKNDWWQKMNSGPAFAVSDLYLQRYPELHRWQDQPGLSQAWRNGFWRCGPLFTTYGKPSIDKFDVLANTDFAQQDPGFVDDAAGDFRLRPDAPLFARLGFRPIPIEEIGLYADPHRASWPVDLAAVTASRSRGRPNGKNSQWP